MKKFKVRYIILIVLALALLLNEGSRTVFVRYFEIRRLNASIERARHENALLRQRVYFLEHEPSFLERMVRAELGVISAGEIEYRFETPRAR